MCYVMPAEPIYIFQFHVDKSAEVCYKKSCVEAASCLFDDTASQL